MTTIVQGWQMSEEPEELLSLRRNPEQW